MSRLCIVLDANDGPCVRSLFKALALKGWRVVLVRVFSLPHLFRCGCVPFTLKETHPGVWRQTLIVPGFSRQRAWSEAVVKWCRKHIEKKLGKPDVAVYTMPRYSRIIAEEPQPSVYFAYDPYKYYYDYDYDLTESDERELMSHAGSLVSVSAQICDDWRSQGGNKDILHLPNAVEERFLKDCSTPSSGGVPEEIGRLGHPIIGCVGNIDNNYDWSLVEKLAVAVPDATFVFCGEIQRMVPQIRDLEELGNVVFAGWKPASLLREYMKAFDVCLNPLSVNSLNDRRCPLRLYSYMCTDKPIVSTSIREAHELKDHLYIAGSHEECVAIMKDAVDGRLSVHAESRREFMAGQTWARRADKMAQHLEKIVRR